MKLTLKAVLRKDKVNTNNEHPIIIRVTYANEKSRVGIGYSVRATQWDERLQMPNNRCEEKLTREIVRKIDSEKERIENLFNDYIRDNDTYPPHPILLRLLKDTSGLKKKSITFNNQIIEEYYNFVREKSSNREATIKAYNSTGVRFEEFLKTYKLHNYADLDDRFYHRFVEWLRSKDYRSGTIGKFIKNIIAFLYHLSKKGKVIVAQFQDFEVDRNYQTKPDLELQDILIMKFALGLEKSKEYDKLQIKLTAEERNILIVMLWLIYTGQSFIDCGAVSISNVSSYQDKNGEEHLFIKYTRTKNKKKKEVKMPLTEPILDLLLFYYSNYKTPASIIKKLTAKVLASNEKNAINKKFKDKYYVSVWQMTSILKVFPILEKELPHHPYLIPQYSLQYYNRALKQVAEKIGLTRSVSTGVTWGGRLSVQRKDRLCDLISTHLGRRAYISSQREINVPYEVIMEKTGISSMNTLLNYNRVTMEQLIPTASHTPEFKSNSEIEKNLVYNIQLNKYEKKNNAPSRYSQLKKK